MPRERYQGRAGDRVQTRGGVIGIVYSCRGKRGPYLKAKMADGSWLWPNQVLAESSGGFAAFCGECGIEFRTDAPNANGCPCPNCVAEDRRHERPDHDGAKTWTPSRFGRAPNFTPAPVQSTATDEQRERIERGRVTTDDAPF